MKRSLDALDVAGRRVFVRVDFNVPLSDGGTFDDARIRAALPTIRDLRRRGARIVLGSHFGRAKGRVRPELSLAPVAGLLGELIGAPVALAPDSVGDEVERITLDLQDGDVLLLENLRFHPGEEANDSDHVAALARLADLYVNDAFGALHRAHASTEGLARVLPAAAGHLIAAEIDALRRVTADPARPFAVLAGGAKISDKLGVLHTIAARADVLLLGGGLANTFLAAHGLDIGASLVEHGQEANVRAVEQAAADAGCRLVLPSDGVAADRVSAGAAHRVVAIDAVPHGCALVDIGPRTVAEFGRCVGGAATVLWSGTVGVYEIDQFAVGTRGVARALAESGAFVVVAGGDACAAAGAAGVADRMGYLSTGGGATLEFIEGRTLPGLAALPDA